MCAGREFTLVIVHCSQKKISDVFVLLESGLILSLYNSFAILLASLESFKKHLIKSKLIFFNFNEIKTLTCCLVWEWSYVSADLIEFEILLKFPSFKLYKYSVHQKESIKTIIAKFVLYI